MNLEDRVVSTVHAAITDAIKAKLSAGYNSPLDLLIKQAIDKHSEGITAVLDSAINSALQGDFAVALADACARKLARVLISKMEGEIEKRVGELRSSPEFRSRLTVAVSDLVKSMAAPT